MLFSPAYAQDAAIGSSNSIMSLLPLVLVFVVFYFLIIRPQSKKAKERRAMLEAVRRGDRIVTAGGIIGTVVRVKDDKELQVEIAENVRVRVMRSMVASVLSKTETAENPSKEDQAIKKEEK